MAARVQAGLLSNRPRYPELRIGWVVVGCRGLECEKVLAVVLKKYLFTLRSRQSPGVRQARSLIPIYYYLYRKVSLNNSYLQSDAQVEPRPDEIEQIVDTSLRRYFESFATITIRSCIPTQQGQTNSRGISPASMVRTLAGD